MNNNVSIARVCKFSGAFIACAIGSGFATGQEIMQFFTAHGAMGIAGTVVTTILFAWAGSRFMKHGYEQQLKEPGDIVGYYFGKKTGKVIQIIMQIFLFGVFLIMISGAGTTLSEYFGLNPMIGRIGMATLAFFTVILGLTKITDVLGTLGSVIIVFAVGIGIYGIVTGAGNLSESIALIPDLDITTAQGGWLGSAILYPGFNTVVVIVLASSIGKGAGSAKEASLSGFIGGLLFGASVIVMNLGLTANIDGLYSKTVPTLVLAQKISPVLAVAFSVIICCGIYTTTVPMLWGVVRTFAEDKSKKCVIVAFIVSAVGLVLGMTDFKVLVNVIYPFSGYLGVIFLVLAAYRDIQGRKAKLRLSERAEASIIQADTAK